MTIRIECRSVSPLLMHSDRASDPLSRDAKWLSEISGKRKKTETDIMELARREFHCSLYLDIAGRPTIPIDNVHSCLYAAARRRKEGPLFSGSFTVSSVKLDYDGPGRAGRAMGTAGHLRRSPLSQGGHVARDPHACDFPQSGL